MLVLIGWTDIVTYFLSVLAIIVTGIVLIQGYRDTAALHASLMKFFLPCAKPATILSDWNTKTRKKSQL